MSPGLASSNPTVNRSLPTAAVSSGLSEVGSCASDASETLGTVTLSRFLKNAFTGWPKNRWRSDSSIDIAGSPAGSSGAASSICGTGARSSAEAMAAAPSSAVGSKLNGPAEPSLMKFRRSNAWRGWVHTSPASGSRSSLADRSNVVRRRSSSSSSRTDSGTGSFVRTSVEVQVITRWSRAEPSAASSSALASLRGSRSPTNGTTCARSSPDDAPPGSASWSRPSTHSTRNGTPASSDGRATTTEP